MKTKIDRLQTIKEIVVNNRVNSQDELLKSLIDKGYTLTQATLSRDLKQLQIAKVPSMDGGYLYVLPETASLGRIAQSKVYNTFPMSATGYLSIEFSGQLAVVKTRPGYASSIAYDIDVNAPYEIIGTIAGDDTILLILREGITAKETIDSLSNFISGMKED